MYCTDPLTHLNLKGEPVPGDNMIDLVIPKGFPLQQALRPALLDASLVGRGLLMRLRLGWFGELLHVELSFYSNRNNYDFRVVLGHDDRTHSMALCLNACPAEESTCEGAWVLLEPTASIRVSSSGRRFTENVRRTKMSA